MSSIAPSAATMPQSVAVPQYATVPQAQQQLAAVPQAQQQLAYPATQQGYGYGAPVSGPTAPFSTGVASQGGVSGPVYVSSLSQVPQGAVPISQQMLAQALGQGQLGAQVVQPGASTTSPLKSMLAGAGIGAAAGAAFGIIPFLPLGLVSGGLVGGIIGAGIGLIKGLKKRKAENEFHTMQAQALAQQVATTAAAAPAPAAEPKPAPVKKKPVTHKKPVAAKAPAK